MTKVEERKFRIIAGVVVLVAVLTALVLVFAL